ncbi:Ser/Thr protein phosphatase protein [Dichomitus squalens LYAD-421 SS1]|uniref:Ser/Thr protein phosphatase protein n=1 Tax=Dichomitus squalens TaxID=114155 RepID=A0A4Q9Q8Q0_9APHY|nr:Ser/Thr protein phosphatase protein [Dichomitus squalens LYAD-421 SS1]EJF66790.1 Ser/Thr protein phosphatase protein [Dichomitus squalens LYAD-421 SS1]TBU34812.1 Ser/Thr protein phosphatase protein [Dichomitus squalens]TBU63845.1 Ser/Thr protein phosphatase protein [Dichomitus squalens]
MGEHSETETSSTLPTVRIQLLSDLHLEMPRPYHPESGYSEDGHVFEYDFPARADVLALLGDIGVTRDDRFFAWLRSQLKRFKLVLFLSGNHEAYHSSLEASNRRLVAFAAQCDEWAANPPAGQSIGRFVLLDRTRFDLSDTVTVLGCTLWSRLDMLNAEMLCLGLNDFRLISDMNIATYTALHRRDVEWLERSITQIARDEPHRRIVVMTHHAPTVADTSEERFVGGPLNSAFATELTEGPCWNERVKVWMFGHTHWPCDFERKGVRVVSNPRGYRHAMDGFEPHMVVEI